MTSTRSRPALACLAVIGGVLAAAPAPAQWRLFESEFDEEKKPWVEIEAKLPAAPRPENLIPFLPGGATAHRFFVDAPSISVGEDGVVRYTLVVKTTGGATNVGYEGIRCETAEHKLYAVGRSNGRWVRARDPGWRRIEYKEINAHHRTLYGDYLCPDKGRMTTVQRIQEALRRDSVRVP